MLTTDFKADIENRYFTLQECADEALCKNARVILENEPCLHEFVSGMGCVLFTRDNEDDGDSITPRSILHDPESLDIAGLSVDTIKRLQAWFEDYRWYQGFFGYMSPVRFTTTGEYIHDW